VVGVRLQAVELFRVSVPLRRPFRAAHGVTTHKDSVLLRVHTDEGIGWGECAAERTPS
jgi:O-succinylbenzoate synthase